VTTTSISKRRKTETSSTTAIRQYSNSSSSSTTAISQSSNSSSSSTVSTVSTATTTATETTATETTATETFDAETPCGTITIGDYIYWIDSIYENNGNFFANARNTSSTWERSSIDINYLYNEHDKQLKKGHLLMIMMEFGYLNKDNVFTSLDADRIRLRAFNKIFSGIETIDTWSKNDGLQNDNTALLKGYRNNKYSTGIYVKNWGNHIHFTHELTRNSESSDSATRGMDSLLESMEKEKRKYGVICIDYNRFAENYVTDICSAFPYLLLSLSNYIQDGGKIYIAEARDLYDSLMKLNEDAKKIKKKKQLYDDLETLYDFDAVIPLRNPLFFVTAFCNDVEAVNSSPLKYDSLTSMFCCVQKRKQGDPKSKNIKTYLDEFKQRLDGRKEWIKDYTTRSNLSTKITRKEANSSKSSKDTNKKTTMGKRKKAVKSIKKAVKKYVITSISIYLSAKIIITPIGKENPAPPAQKMYCKR
jgi:hypothetical protein